SDDVVIDVTGNEAWERNGQVPTRERDGAAMSERAEELASAHWRERAIVWRERAIAAEQVAKTLQRNLEDLRANLHDVRRDAERTSTEMDSPEDDRSGILAPWRRLLQDLSDKYVR